MKMPLTFYNNRNLIKIKPTLKHRLRDAEDAAERQRIMDQLDAVEAERQRRNGRK